MSSSQSPEIVVAKKRGRPLGSKNHVHHAPKSKEQKQGEQKFRGERKGKLHKEACVAKDRNNQLHDIENHSDTRMKIATEPEEEHRTKQLECNRVEQKERSLAETHSLTSIAKNEVITTGEIKDLGKWLEVAMQYGVTARDFATIIIPGPGSTVTTGSGSAVIAGTGASVATGSGSAGGVCPRLFATVLSTSAMMGNVNLHDFSCHCPTPHPTQLIMRPGDGTIDPWLLGGGSKWMP